MDLDALVKTDMQTCTCSKRIIETAGVLVCMN